MSSRMAILIPCLLAGGTEVSSLETAIAFRHVGFEVELIVYFDEVDWSMHKSFVQAGVKVRLLNVRRRGGVLVNVQLAAGLVSALARGRYEIIWLQYMTPTLLPIIVARMFSPVLLAALHVMGNHYSPTAVKRIRWLAAHWCSRFVCVSNAIYNSIFSSMDTPRQLQKQIVVIPNAINTGDALKAPTHNWRVERGWPRDSFVVGYVGRLAQIKGADVLLRAVHSIIQDNKLVRLVIIGDGPERETLEAMAVQLGIHNSVHFAGSVERERIYSAIKGFDIAVVPSREEGFGLSALEAMVSGIPVIASRLGGLAEVVVDKETGLLCRPADPVQLGKKLQFLIGDPVLRQRLGMAGKVNAASLYDRVAYQHRIANLLASLTSACDKPRLPFIVRIEDLLKSCCRRSHDADRSR